MCSSQDLRLRSMLTFCNITACKVWDTWSNNPTWQIVWSWFHQVDLVAMVISPGSNPGFHDLTLLEGHFLCKPCCISCFFFCLIFLYVILSLFHLVMKRLPYVRLYVCFTCCNKYLSCNGLKIICSTVWCNIIIFLVMALKLYAILYDAIFCKR